MRYIIPLLLASVISACSMPPTATPAQAIPVEPEEDSMSLNLSSPAFAEGQSIPAVYSCKGRDISPALSWTEPPPNTKSFALVMDDPDAPAGIWVHWVIFNVPASARGLTEAQPAKTQLSDGSVQGRTSAGSNGYHGPCPPSGTHRYYFKLYALDTMLSLSSDATKEQLSKAMEGHILAQGQLMGTFSK